MKQKQRETRKHTKDFGWCISKYLQAFETKLQYITTVDIFWNYLIVNMTAFVIVYNIVYNNSMSVLSFYYLLLTFVIVLYRFWKFGICHFRGINISLDNISNFIPLTYCFQCKKWQKARFSLLLCLCFWQILFYVL